MDGKKNDNYAVYTIEQATAKCETLSILPAVISRFIDQLARMELTPGSLAELIESDPALTILAFQLCRKKEIPINRLIDGDSWVQRLLEAVSIREMRDSILDSKVYGGLDENPQAVFRKELIRHSLAVAACAGRLAEIVQPSIDSRSAYLAGLLHDVGKFVLDEVMPKSFDTLLEQAKLEKTGFCDVERKNLGIDHTLIGKRFAQKLRLPADVILGIWLHHSHSGQLANAVPRARIAAVVEIADCIVRKAGLGQSGSFEEIKTETIASSLGITAAQITEVEKILPDIVRQKSETAGLNILRPGWAYCDSLRTITGQLAGESAKLSDESARLQSSASNFEFIKDLLPEIESAQSALEAGEKLAVNWQRFFQTGPVCVYIVSQDDSKTVQAVIADGLNKTRTFVFDVPGDIDLIPQATGAKFELCDASQYVDWLAEQTGVEFDMSRTKLVPLRSAGRTPAVIIFELRHPANGDVAQRFAPAARTGAVLLDLFESAGSQQWLAERFAEALSSAKQVSLNTVQSTEPSPLKIEQKPRLADAEALAEMAAGAAHELNNPLSVIAGRAQLLANAEPDPEKKRILVQIQQNAGELSAILDDLMSYANPAAPKPTEMTVRQIIDEAIDLAGTKTAVSRANIKFDISPDIPNVYIDSAQVDIAVANIICNAVESYDGRPGPLTIQASGEPSKNSVTIRITDAGRGMDEQTLRRATQPFFSAMPAGRKRGMGLSHSQRLILLNGGEVHIASQPGNGTTVSVVLPCK